MKSLFRSQLTYNILRLLSQNEDKSYYLAEVSKNIGSDSGNAMKELRRLVNEGYVNQHEASGKKYYSINKEQPQFQTLTGLLEQGQDQELKERFEQEWLLGEDIPNMTPFFSMVWLNCFVDEFAQPGGRAYRKIAGIFKDYHLWFYYDKADAQQVADHIVDRFVADPYFMAQVNKEIVSFSDELRSYSETIPETGLEKLSEKRLWKIFKKHEDAHTAYYQWGWLPVAADMFTDALTEKGKAILREHGVGEDEVNEYLTVLTQPTKPSLMKKEQDELVDIALDVQRDDKRAALFRELIRKFKEEDVKEFGLYTHSPQYEKALEEKVRELISEIPQNILQRLQEHHAKYFYTKFLFTEEQGVYSFEHYLKELVRLVCRGDELKLEREKGERAIQEADKEKKEMTKRLNLESNWITFFDEWGGFMVTKIYRRYAQLFALYKISAVLEEIGRRFGLTQKEVSFMTSEEIEAALQGKAIDKDVIKARVSFSVYYADKETHQFYVGSEAQRAAKLIQKEVIEQVNEFTGQCGCQGYAKGKVKIVNVVADMSKVEPGDILVSISTQPDLLPAMKKAAAFVTEQGGVTSHAAIVAREMNKPCVIGTKIATKVLKDGMEVEVDATRGRVTLLQ